MVSGLNSAYTLRSFCKIPSTIPNEGGSMRLALMFAVMCLLIPYPKAAGQSVSAFPVETPLDLPTSQRVYKPKISLQAALKIAESYVATEHINVSDGWLSQARF